jgi:predicted acetyltransferase
MAIEVRPARPDEYRFGLRPILHFFGTSPKDENPIERLLPADRLHVAFDDGEAVGGAGVFPFELTVPGGRLRGAGVTMIAVLPTHRRRGILRRMMRAQLDDVRERGEVVAYLWASEPMIYRRFGYGLASLAGEIEISRARADFHTPLERRGRVRLVDVDEARELLPPIYEQVASEMPGMFSRTPEWWEGRTLADPKQRRDGGGEMNRAVLELDGRPQGYALYRLHPSFEYGASTGFTRVIEAMGVTPQATAEIWRFALDVDWMDRIKASNLPVDHPLFLLLAEPRRMRFVTTDFFWLRLVDLEPALGVRAYGPGEPVVIEVSDGFCAWNQGRWRVGEGGPKRTDAAPGLRLDISALASAYLGGFTFAELARALQVEELEPGAVERADALFRTDRAPWCPEVF